MMIDEKKVRLQSFRLGKGRALQKHQLNWRFLSLSLLFSFSFSFSLFLSLSPLLLFHSLTLSVYVCERVCQCVLVRKGEERKGEGKGGKRREEIRERKQELYCKSSTTAPTVTSHWCRKVTSDKDDKTNDTCDVCISRSSRTRHSDQIAQREEHLGSRGSGLVSVMSIITPIHSSSNQSIHPFLSIHSIHHSGTIAQLHILSYIFFMNSTELELVVTLVDSTFYTSIHPYTPRPR